jgi:hypothetical protein
VLSSFVIRHSSFHSERGVALVITLILLSVITFMAVTFLVVTQGEKKSVSTQTDQVVAKMMVDEGVEMAKAQLMSRMLAYTNPFVVNLIVSTNYISPAGYVTGNTRFTNVNYAYPNGAPVTGNDALQNLMNMRYLPRAPVFITNRAAANSYTFPFYDDLNRNGRFDTNGPTPVISNDPLRPYYDTNGNTMANIIPGNTLSNVMVGDPEWVGVEERPSFPSALFPPQNPGGPSPFGPGFGHSPSNRFIGRYAFLVVPTSLALDINTIHNYSKLLQPFNMSSGDGFLRNMGAGSYEINYAAFLTDLNTNYWPPTNGNTAYGQWYLYNPFRSLQANFGAGFDDAVAMLRYRYGGNWNNGLSSVTALFGAPGVTAFGKDYVDGYASGPLMTGFHWPPLGGSDPELSGRVKAGWAGSDNTNHIFDTQDFFDRSKMGTNFVDRLMAAGGTNSTYDRTTFYRLVQQLGTDSAPDQNKLNLNYVNVDLNGNIVPDMATNFIEWRATQFFTNAAARMLADVFADTNVVEVPKGGGPRLHIQIYPTNYYLPSVHRALQLAANIYDFRTTNGGSYPFFPSVFKPVFDSVLASGTTPQQVFITDYVEVTNTDVLDPNKFRFRDLGDPLDVPKIRPFNMVYGIPLVVGAKQGYPNFNQLGMQTDVTVSRNMGYHRLSPTSFQTNQSYSIGISNSIGVEAWNSYNTNFPRALSVYCNAMVLMAVTNEAGAVRGPSTLRPFSSVFSNLVSMPTNWPASGLAVTTSINGAPAVSKASFRLPLYTSYYALPPSTYLHDQNQFLSNSFGLTDGPNYFPVPHWWLNITTRLRFALIDTSPQAVAASGGGLGRIVDYVNLNSADPPVDVADLIQRNVGGDYPGSCGGVFNSEIGQLFCTNRVGNQNANNNVLPYGLLYQEQISKGVRGSLNVPDNWWRQYNAQVNDKTASSLQFYARLTGTDTTTDFQAPFSPKRIVHSYVNWSANDPLVHYMTADLNDFLGGKKKIELDENTVSSPIPNLGVGGGLSLNDNYRPWNANGNARSETRYPSRANLAVKDPLIGRSDDWDFPTNSLKFPSIGWLGRVHRGTPWQTLYLKAPPAEVTNTWPNWSGHVITNWDNHFTVLNDSIRTHPTNDFHLLDLFTTSFNDNASRGKLPVNQTNLAAWSAVLSGVIVTTNTLTNYTIIEPAGIHNAFAASSTKPPLARIVDGINRTRAAQPAGVFKRVGDILSTPELTTGSPYLNTNNTAVLSDEVYERIPQQILSLLSGGESARFVIYTFGQTLKPAERSIMNNGAYFGLCTNYQVVAETAVRAVVRVDGSPDPAQANNPDPQKRYPPRVVMESYNVLPPY